MKLIDEIINNNDQDKLSNYLSSRGLLPFDDCYWCDGVVHNNIIYSGLFIIIRSADGEPTMVENRSVMGEWTKVWSDPDRIPIWNTSAINKCNSIIITESILDAQSILQYTKHNNVISFMRASFTSSQFYLFSYLFNGKKIITLFDNDDGGKYGFNRLKSMSSIFRFDVNKVSFPYNDVNEYLVRSPRRFSQTINSLISEQLNG